MHSRTTSIVALAAITSYGCATLFASKSTSVPAGSEPSGAEVFVDGNRVGMSPTTVELDHKRDHTVTFRKAGYKEVTCTVTRSVGAGWVILDVLGGLLPVVIDAATGSWNSLKPKLCNVNLPAGQ